MGISDFKEVHEKVMRAKEKGQPIRATLKKYGISKTTYYRELRQNGGENWMRAKRGKIVYKHQSCASVEEQVNKRAIKNGPNCPKKKTSKKKRQREMMSGGSVVPTNLEGGNESVLKTLERLKRRSLEADKKWGKIYSGQK